MGAAKRNPSPQLVGGNQEIIFTKKAAKSTKGCPRLNLSRFVTFVFFVVVV